MASIFPEETLRKVRDKINIVSVLQAINYRLDTIQEIGDTVKCFCPIHKEAVFRTLIIERRTNRFRCSYSLCAGHRGGDLIDLYAGALGIDYDEAVRRLVRQMGIAIDLPPAEDYVQKTLEVAENYLTLRSYEDAEKGFQKILAVQPDNLVALRGMLDIHRARNEEENRLAVLGRLAAVAVDKKRFVEAADYCREILEKKPDDAATRLRYVECLVGQGEAHRALEEYMRLADYFETRREFDKALDVYRRIEQLNLDIIDVYPHIIQLMVASDRTRDAVEETLQKATAHERKGEYDRALECYRYVLEIDETRADVREKLIDTAIVAGLDESLIEQCLQSIDAYFREEAYASAARALEKMHQAAPGHVRVMGKYVEVLRRESRDAAAAQAQLELVNGLLERGQIEEARNQLRSLGSTVDLGVDLLTQLATAQRQCGLAAEAAETYLAVAERLEAQGQMDDAAQVVAAVIELNPAVPAYRQKRIDLLLQAGHPEAARPESTALAAFLIDQQEWDAAESVVSRALKTAPDDPTLLEYQAQVFSAKGRDVEAEKRYLALARSNVASGNWEAARRALQRVLAANPNHVEAALLLADVSKNLGDPRQAREHLQRLAPALMAQKDFARAEQALIKLHELVPDDTLALVHLATVYAHLDQENQLLETYRRLVSIYLANEAFAKALEYCTAILDRDPENIWALEQMIRIYEKTDKARLIPELCLRLAQIYEKLDDTDQVQEYYERALKTDPANTQARIDYVRFLAALHRHEAASQQAQIAIGQLADQGRYPDAIQMIEALLEQSPDDVALRRSLIDLCRKARMEREFVTHCTQLINLYYRRNDFAEVVELYRELLEHEPQNVTFRTHLIDALMRLKRRDEAIAQYFELVDYYLKKQNLEDAESTLLELLDQSPGNPRALEMLVDILIELGRHDQAVQRIRELSEIYVGVGKNDRAAEVLRRVLAFDPGNREVRRRIAEIAREDEHAGATMEELLARAASLWQEGNVAAALETQREAVRLRPEDTVVRKRLTEMLLHQGNTGAALDELIQVARIRAGQGQYEQAMVAVDDVLKHDPTSQAARRLRAELFAKMGDRKRALDEFMSITADSTPTPGTAARGAEAPLDLFPAEPLKIVPEFTFDNFVVGDRNRFAHATALAVAKAPAVHYNPVFLYSDVGLGKTHLISAIANYVLAHLSDLRVLYTSAEEFTSQLVQAIQNNTVNLFRNRYKAADVLLVDDIHFLAGKERAQEEFFHVFNTLFQAKRQIVVTSDRPPKDIARLEKRLKSRFGSGVIVDIQPPDLETRVAILRKELERGGAVAVEDRLLTRIAEAIHSNVRELKGALNQILIKHQLSGATIDDALVSEVMRVYTEQE